MKVVVLWLQCALLAAIGVPARAQARGGRYDAQIKAGVSELLKSKNEYKNVQALVEDSVVTLSGNVELDSTRQSLIARVRRIPHVESVESNVVLSPPAEPDQTLMGRVQRALDDAGFPEIKIHVHEGAVRLEGTVRNAKERERAIQLVRMTEGVKEVQASSLTAAE